MAEPLVHNSHFVPRMYLKNWSHDGNKVFTYELYAQHENQPKWFNRSIKHCCSQSLIYTLPKKHPDRNAIEKYFDQTIEQPASAAFSKLSNDQPLSAADHMGLINFLICQLFRTPSYQAKEAQFYKKHFAATLEKVIQNREYEMQHGISCVQYEKPADMADNPPFPPHPIKMTLNAEHQTIQAEMLLGRQSHLASLGPLMNGTIGQTLRNYPWTIIRMPEGYKLPTSDNPVVVFSPTENGGITYCCGLGQQKTDILMPLNPNCALFTEVGASMNELNDYVPSPSDYQTFKSAIVHEASEVIINATRDDETIEQMRPRIIDPDHVKRIAESKKTWPSIQDEYENAFIPSDGSKAEP